MISHFDRVNHIVHQDDDGRFADVEDDTVLIQTVKDDDPNMIWVTADITQKKNPRERLALRESGMNIVFFKRFHKNADAHYQAMKVLSVWPTICRLCENARDPTVFEVPAGTFKSNKVDVLGKTSDLFD